MNLQETGFSIVPNKAAEDADYLQRISTISGLPLGSINPKDISIMANGAMSQDPLIQAIRQSLINKYFRNLFDQKSGNANLQYAIAGYAETSLVTYGTAMDFYQKGLTKYQADNPDKKEHNALLSGAFSAVSMIEFTASTKQIIPNANCLTIDFEDTDKPQNTSANCQFLKSDVCSLQLPPIFDSVHTSGLLDHLGTSDFPHSTDSPYLAKLRQSFFESIAGTLRSNGILLLVERPIDITKPPAEQPFIRELGNIGYKDIAVNKVKAFRNRRLLDRHMKSTAREIQSDYLIEDPYLIGITARI